MKKPLSMERRKDLARIGMLIASVFAAMYVAALAQWLLMVVLMCRFADSAHWPVLYQAFPCVLLLGIALVALYNRRNLKKLWTLILLAATIMVCWSAYDYAHENYQVGEHSAAHGLEQYHVPGRGATHYYINWPWLYWFD